MFNMENYRTSTRLYFLHSCTSSRSRGSERLPGSHFIRAQHGGWTAGSRTVIQEPLAPAVEADGQPCPPSLQLTEKLVSNLEEREASVTRGLGMEICKVSPSDSWFSGPPMHTAAQPWLLFCNKSFKKAIEIPYKALAQVQNNFKMANTRQKQPSAICRVQTRGLSYLIV